MYFLRPDAFDVIDHLLPSGRGELEITDVLNHYIPDGRLYSPIYDGHWTDAGTVAVAAARRGAGRRRRRGWAPLAAGQPPRRVRS